MALRKGRSDLVRSTNVGEQFLSELVSASVISPPFIEEVKVSNSVALFLLRNAMQSAVMPQYVFCMSVRPSVTVRYFFHTGWNTSKIISRLNSLRYQPAQIDHSMGNLSNGDTPKIRVE